MELNDFDYSLPKGLIAQKPLEKRDSSRLMAVDIKNSRIEHRHFSDIIGYLSKNDVLVVNDSKVIPAKLTGKKETGGKVGILLIRQISPLNWECIAQGKNLESRKINFGSFYGTIRRENEKCIIEFSEDIGKLLLKVGKAPLPPYIKSDIGLERYNTVYSEKEGSIAAPTAGLHFTRALLGKLENKGVVIAPITLHVGLGTFLPVRANDVKMHKMHHEFFSISGETAGRINSRKGSLFVIGTTSIRALESSVKGNAVVPKTVETDLFIRPGYKWKLGYKGLITNFHLPRTTLLMLACAFAGRKLILRAYEDAVAEKYRFYSFGDAMALIK